MAAFTTRHAARGLLGAVFALALAPAALADAIREGTFEGRSGHAVSGTAQVVERGGEMVLVLGRDFSLDSAPDPKIAFGATGETPERMVAPLKKTAGEQTYTLPDWVGAADTPGVYVWCERYSVPLGYAAFE